MKIRYNLSIGGEKMKIIKLLENITKGKLENNTRIKVNNSIEIIYKCDEELQKYYFEDLLGKKIDIMNFFNCDFEFVVERVTKDIWDEVCESLNLNNDYNSNIEKGIGTSNKTNDKMAKFTISSLKDNSSKAPNSYGICLFMMT